LTAGVPHRPIWTARPGLPPSCSACPRGCAPRKSVESRQPTMGGPDWLFIKGGAGQQSGGSAPEIRGIRTSSDPSGVGPSGLCSSGDGPRRLTPPADHVSALPGLMETLFSGNQRGRIQVRRTGTFPAGVVRPRSQLNIRFIGPAGRQTVVPESWLPSDSGRSARPIRTKPSSRLAPPTYQRHTPTEGVAPGPSPWEQHGRWITMP